MALPWQTTPFLGRWRGLWKRGRQVNIDPMFAAEAKNVELYGNVIRKRKGTRRLHTSAMIGRVHAIHDARFRNGTAHVLAAAGNGFAIVAQPPGSILTSYPSGSPARIGHPRGHFVSFADLVFFVNGVDLNVKYDSVQLTQMGIEPPTVAPTFGAATPGVATAGDHGFRYTYVYPLTQHESEPSPEARFTLGANQQVPVTAAPSPDFQAERVRFYATTAGGGGVWFFAGEIPTNGGTFTFNIADTSLGSELEEFLNDPPGRLRILAHWPHTDRLLGVMEDEPSLLRWCDHGLGFPKPESWPFENLFPVNFDDGDEIVAIHSLFDSVIVQKSRSTWRVRGFPPDLSIEPIHFHADRTGIGGMNQKAACEFDNDLFLPGRDQANSLSRWYDSGFQSQALSTAIEDLWRQFGIGAVDRAHAIYYRAKSQIRFFIPSPPLLDPDRCLVFQLSGSDGGEPNGWTLWELGATASAVVQTLIGDRVYLGTGDGYVEEMDQAFEDHWSGATPGDGAPYLFEYLTVPVAPTLESQVDTRMRRWEGVVRAAAPSVVTVTPRTDLLQDWPPFIIGIEPRSGFLLDTEPPSLPGAGILGVTPLGAGDLTQEFVAGFEARGRFHQLRFQNFERSADFAIESWVLRWQALGPKHRAHSTLQVLA